MRILGIHDGHGASAAILEDGELVRAYEEERFTRLKADTGFPKRALTALQGEFSSGLRDVDHVAIATVNHDFSLFATKRYPLFSVGDFLEEERRYWIPKLIEGRELDYLEVMKEYVDFSLSHYPLASVRNRGDYEEIRALRRDFTAAFLGVSPDRISFVDHHTCHAHHAYYSSPLRGTDVLVVTIDGAGDGLNATIHTVDGDGRLRSQYRTGLCNLGRIYSFVTLLLGMKPSEHEYKVMGLAAYTKEKYIQAPLEVFRSTYYVDGLEFKARQPIRNHYQFLRARLEGQRFDAIAGALQQYAEELITTWIGNWLRHTGTRRVALSGGVALNVKANMKVAELPEVDDLFVCPGGGNESISIGAAQVAHVERAGPGGLRPMRSAYHNGGFTEAEAQAAFERPALKDDYEVVADGNPDAVAEALDGGNVVAVCVGRSEFGPRALGHRSLIADPRSRAVVRVLNEAIKSRDFWMPFTPSILRERADDYLINPKKLRAPFMTVTFETTELARQHLAAAIHDYDKTIRPQLVEREISPEYYDVIKAFERRTGVGGVLNTSLNIHGKPIVRTPMELIDEVLSNANVNLPYLLIGPRLFRRRAGRS